MPSLPMSSAASISMNSGVPLACVAPENLDPSECVTGIVVVDQHAQDLKAIHSQFELKVTIMTLGQPHLRVISHIADGTWSSVHYAFNQEQQRFAALKVVPTGAANAESAEAEVETLRKLSHPNIVQYYGHFIRCFNRVKCLCIELEYCGKHTLADCLLAQQQRQLSAATVVTFASQLAAALNYLHTRDVLHGDVRAETILVTEDNQLKLSSFGSPLWVERRGLVRRTITGGDQVYAPPEWEDSTVPHRLLKEWERPLPSYDMWSLGCVVTELVTRKLLQQHRHCTASIGADPDKLREVFDDIADAYGGLFAPLCSKLLVADADERLTAEEAGQRLEGLVIECAPKSARRWLSLLRTCLLPEPQDDL